MVKPRIRKHPVFGWDCEGAEILGSGATPGSAYASWNIAYQRFMASWREKWAPPAKVWRLDPPPHWGDNTAPKYLPPPWTVTC